MEKQTYFQRVKELTPTRFWINNVTQKEALMAIEAGASGCTQNPSYTLKMLKDPEESINATKLLDSFLKIEKDDSEVLVLLQKELVARIGKIFMPMYEGSGCREGFVSIQGDPFKEDTETIIRHARLNREAGENIMAKVPVTKDGLDAIEVLARERVPINATEVMAVKQAIDVCEVYEKVTKGMKNPAPLYFSHITGIYDEYLSRIVKEKNIDISPDVLWQAGSSIAKKIYWMVKEKKYNVGFIGGGARGLHHFTEMVGADICVTINWKGTADKLIEQNPHVVQRFLQPTPHSVIDDLVEKLDDYRKGYFVNNIKTEEYEHFGPVVLFREMFEESWSDALKLVKNRRGELGA